MSHPNVTPRKLKAAIIGSGNIGSDLMIKIMRYGQCIDMGVMVGIDPESDGLARAKRMGVSTTHEGVDGLVALPEFAEIDIVFDATSAGAHIRNDAFLRRYNPNIRLIDLTPAAIGPYCVPVVNLDQHLDQLNVNMVTCGGQATIPIVAAVAAVAPVYYAEIVASISSKSAGPGTRANIDEFTETTSKAIEVVGGAQKGKAIIVLNPAEPPLLMRDTVYVLSALADQAAVEASIQSTVSEVQRYVSGYRLKQRVQFEVIPETAPLNIAGLGQFSGLKTSVFLEVEGAAHYLPAYAGNLDIMTSAALATAERMASAILQQILIIGIVLAVLAPIIAELIKLAISRKREYAADATGAILSRHPQGLADALKKIKKDSEETKVASKATAHLYFSSPFKGSFANLFSTHPPIDERIRRLEKM